MTLLLLLLLVQGVDNRDWSKEYASSSTCDSRGGIRGGKESKGSWIARDKIIRFGKSSQEVNPARSFHNYNKFDRR